MAGNAAGAWVRGRARTMVVQSRHSIDDFLILLSEHASDHVFNPWAVNCRLTDLEAAAEIRRENLRAVLGACSTVQEVDIWIGRDLGWRGGRRTGVALVDEASLNAYAQSIDLPGLTKATIGPVMRERTATEIHLARSRISRKVFFWNVFPFHPHEANKPQSNRMHTSCERQVGITFLKMILDIIPFEKIIAIGNDATNALNAANIKCHSVRHPSYGGQKYFHKQIDIHYGISSAADEIQEDFLSQEFRA